MKKLLMLTLLILVAVNVHAQSLQDTVALNAFMDGLMLTHLRDKHIAGATVSIVKDGKTLLAKGYGFANDKNQEPVKADSTLFRIGSISKMFTWISVMQLVSEGKLKLDEDVNHYLKDFKIPDTYPQPITLKDIMTHTPGFEDHIIGLFGKDTSTLKPLGEILSQQIPARVRPPGTLASYSNHATGMAGYIVEQISGMSFNDYVEKNILNPLGMTNTTFRQPLPPRFEPLMSKGYKYAGGDFKEQGYEYVPLYPAGSVAASATDMIRFMQAILNHGKLGNAQLLDSVTLAFMEAPAHQHHPAVNPMRYGFIDMSRNGVTVIGHGGDTFWFHSMMALFPESNTGLFFSFNTDTGGGLSGAVIDEFMNRYFPEKNKLAMPFKVNRGFLQRFAGNYRPNRYAYHDLTTFASLLNDASISVVDSTELILTSGETVRYLVPIDSLTFREKRTSKVFAFRKNEKGEIVNMFHGTTPIFAFDKVKGLKGLGLHRTIFLVTSVTTLVVLLFWPFVYWVRRGYQSHHSSQTLPFISRFVAWSNYLLLLIFYLGGAIIMADANQIAYKVPTSLKVLLILPFLNIGLTAIMWVWLVRILQFRYYKPASRLYYLSISLVAIAALWQLYYWNLIGFNY